MGTRSDVSGLTVTVLGSGGPFLDRQRVSSGYIVALDGRPRVIVDAGGGTFQRLGAAGIVTDDIEAVFVTHGHIDHTGGLAPLVFAAAMDGRQRPLPIFGQAGRDGQPGMGEMCRLLFGGDGAWRYLTTFEGFSVEGHDVPSDPDDPTVTDVWEAGGLVVRSVAVPHGMMPAVAYRIQTSTASVVFTGDVSGFHPPLVELARDADLLVHDMALPERHTEHGHLHAKPSDVARTAAQAQVRRLLLSHVMPELDPERVDAEVIVRAGYGGEVEWATDLLTVPV